MVEVGESTGALQEMLNSLAEFYDEEIETEVERFITLIEPVMLVIMGIIIAAVVLALYMPLFELTSVVGGIDATNGNRDPTCCRIRKNTPRRSLAPARWRGGTGWSSSTWTSSGSTRTSSGRFPPI